MYRVSKIIFIILFIILHAQGQYQRIGQWKSFTDMKSVRDAILVDGNCWAASSGGVFTFDTLSRQFRKFNNIDGLASNDMRCIATESGKRIWIGGTDGSVNVYEQRTGLWSTINTNRSGYVQIGVQDLFPYGDTMYIATVFGVIPFKIGKWEFGDTYASLGSLVSPVVSCILVTDSDIFVGTDKGLAIAPRTAINLATPDPWTAYSFFPGISSSSVTSLAIFKDTLVVATNQGTAYFVNGSFGGVINSLSGKSVQRLYVDQEQLIVLRNEGSGFIIESFSSIVGSSQTILSNPSVQASSLIPGTSLWVGTASNGMARQSTAGWDYFYPNGPNSPLFNSLTVDENGVLWAASGANTPAGFYRYNPSLPEEVQWKNFPVFGGAGCYRTSLGAAGSAWISSWGGGVAEIVGDTIRHILNHNSSPSLPGTAEALPNYVVTGCTAADNQDRTWIVNRVAGSGRSLLRLDTDTSATYFDNQFLTTDGFFHSMVIDRNGTKWLAGDLPWEPKSSGFGLNGVYVFNEDPVFYLTDRRGQSTTGYWGHLSTTDGLIKNVVHCFAVDLEGAVWIGTSEGVSIAFDPQYPNQLTTCFPLLQYTPFVQAIAVDASNNKWIGTREGVFIVNTDGTQLLQAYSVASTNGQLLNDDIRAIAIDQKRGIAYFGTDNGLSSLAIEPVQTDQAYSELEIGPNPFILPSNQPLMIRNLVPKSSIKIVTVSGSVIKQFEAQGGGRAFWDGRDKNGMFVSSGIYIIIAYAENGSQTVTGKVAVIRR
jgi:ligand-binding sensor domain-containing protein